MLKFLLDTCDLLSSKKETKNDSELEESARIGKTDCPLGLTLSGSICLHSVRSDHLHRHGPLFQLSSRRVYSSHRLLATLWHRIVSSLLR